MNPIMMELAQLALNGWLKTEPSQEAAYAKLEKKVGADNAPKVWKIVTGKAAPKPTPVQPKVETKPASKRKPAAKPVAKPTPKPASVVAAKPVVAKPAPAATTPPVTDDFAGITKFRNSADCSKWAVTVQISNARIIGGNIQWDEKPGQREVRKWNEKRGKKAINGETIIVIPSRGEAGMFDFLGIGQTRKILANLKASHEGPGFFAPWQPVKGEKIGFCIATISRDKPHAKMQERSNVCWLTIP